MPSPLWLRFFFFFFLAWGIILNSEEKEETAGLLTANSWFRTWKYLERKFLYGKKCHENVNSKEYWSLLLAYLCVLVHNGRFRCKTSTRQSVESSCSEFLKWQPWGVAWVVMIGDDDVLFFSVLKHLVFC